MDPITPQASSFSPWAPISPSVFPFLAGASITLLSRRPGRIDLFATSADGSIWLSSFDDRGQGVAIGNWYPVRELIPPPPDGISPGAASINGAALGVLSPSLGMVAMARSPGVVELLMLDGEGVVWSGRCEPDRPGSQSTWLQPWPRWRGAPGTVLSAISPGPDSQHLFVIGKEGAVWAKSWNSSFAWRDWEPIGDGGIVDPCLRQRVAAVASAEGRVEIFVIDRAGRVITTSMDEGQPWGSWVPVGAETIFSPQAQITALSPDPEHVVLVAPAKDGSVWSAVRERAAWGPWTRIGAGALLAVPARISVTALVRGPGEIELFVAGRDGAVYESGGTATGGFREWTRLEGLSGAIPPQALVSAVACRPDRVDLVVVRSDGVIHAATRGGESWTLPAGEGPPPSQEPPPPPPQRAPLPPPPADEPPRVSRLKLLRTRRPVADLRIKRHAILIGINEYVDPLFKKLSFCVNDVLALKDTLEKSGFASVTALHTDAPELVRRPTRENIKVELMTLCAALGPDDLVLVHFSCHGTLYEGKPYLVPSNTRKMILEETALAVDEVMGILKNSKAHRVVVLLDACHSGASVGRDTSAPDRATEFARNVYERALGAKVLAAATAEQEAKERSDLERGVFTSFVIEALTQVDAFARADRERRGYVTFSDLRDYVCNGVVRFADTHELEPQSPNEGGTSTGDMMIVDYRRPATVV